jgi:hypothetical protein
MDFFVVIPMGFSYILCCRKILCLPFFYVYKNYLYLFVRCVWIVVSFITILSSIAETNRQK